MANPSNNINIQEIRECDIMKYRTSYLELLSQLTVVNADEITETDFQSQIAEITKNPYHEIYLAISDNLIIASATFYIEPKIIRNLGRVGHIEDVVVDQSYRRMGIARQLLQYIIEKARQKACYKIILNCSIDNQPLYEKIGFMAKERQMAMYFVDN